MDAEEVQMIGGAFRQFLSGHDRPLCTLTVNERFKRMPCYTAGATILPGFDKALNPSDNAFIIADQGRPT